MENNNVYQAILDKTVDNKKVFGTTFALQKDNFFWQGASGDFAVDTPFFVASTTKLFTTAIIMQLRNQGLLKLEDKIYSYLNKSVLNELHIWEDKDFSEKLTIQHLLAHTSGLPDYFQGKRKNSLSLEKDILTGNDQSWTFEDVIAISKSMRPLFPPGTRDKAHYSDTNFQILGKIIETITQLSFSNACNQFVIAPLGLKKTYLFHDVNDAIPKGLYYKNKVISIPNAMTSFGADGSIVSTANELLIFIQAFFNGKLFPKKYLNEMFVWNKIFFPMKSGVGVHLFNLPWVLNPLGTVPKFIGHSGLSGTVAFYCPKENLYIAGTVNQIAHPELSFKTMIQLAIKSKSK